MKERVGETSVYLAEVNLEESFRIEHKIRPHDQLTTRLSSERKRMEALFALFSEISRKKESKDQMMRDRGLCIDL